MKDVKYDERFRSYIRNSLSDLFRLVTQHTTQQMYAYQRAEVLSREMDISTVFGDDEIVITIRRKPDSRVRILSKIKKLILQRELSS